MEFNLLFLPLLGGYVFYVRWNFTKFTARRCESERLIFHAAAFGLALLVAARLCVLMARHLPTVPLYGALGLELTCSAAVAVLIASLTSTWISLQRTNQKRRILKRLGRTAIGSALLIGLIVYLGQALGGKVAGRSLSIAITSVLVIVPIELVARHLKRSNRDLALRLIRLRLSLLVLAGGSLVALAAIHGLDLEKIWHEFSPYPESGTAFLACLMGALCWWPLNLLYSAQTSVRRLHLSQQTSVLDRLLFNAASKMEQVQFTMQDGKFYVGFVAGFPNDPDSTDSLIQFLPMASGYRDVSTKEVRFTTFYDQVYADLSAEDIQAFYRIIPRAQVISAGLFRQDLYLKFTAPDPGSVSVGGGLSTASEAEAPRSEGSSEGIHSG